MLIKQTLWGKIYEYLDSLNQMGPQIEEKNLR